MKRPDRMVFYEGLSDLQQAEMGHLLALFSTTLPGWVDRVTVVLWSPTPEEPKFDHNAVVTLQPEYRRLCITIDESFFSHTYHERKYRVAHELAHAVLAPFCVQWRTDIQMALPDGVDDPRYKVMADNWTDRIEAATSDLTAMLLRVVDADSSAAVRA